MLASDLVAKHLPTSACNDASSYLNLEIRSLIYEDEELTRLWNDVSTVPREFITRILMRYYVITGYELGVRYERDYHDKNFQPDDSVGRYLIAADSDKVEDGLIFGYSLEYNKVILRTNSANQIIKHWWTSFRYRFVGIWLIRCRARPHTIIQTLICPMAKSR